MMKSGIENKLKFLHAHYGILELIFTTRFSFGFWHKITNSLTKMTLAHGGISIKFFVMFVCLYDQ